MFAGEFAEAVYYQDLGLAPQHRMLMNLPPVPDIEGPPPHGNNPENIQTTHI